MPHPLHHRQRHLPGIVLASLAGVAIIALLVIGLPRWSGAPRRLPETPQVIGRWTMTVSDGTCHRGTWILGIGPTSIEVQDPAGRVRTAPCTIDAPPHERALVMFRQDAGFGDGIRTAAFHRRPDGSVFVILAQDDMSPGCSHPVNRL